jgi:hypothetical protein
LNGKEGDIEDEDSTLECGRLDEREVTADGLTWANVDLISAEDHSR